MKIFALTIKNSDEIGSHEIVTSFIFTKESEAKKIAKEFDKRNKSLIPLIKKGTDSVRCKLFNSNKVERRKWGYKELIICDGMTPKKMNKKFPMYTEQEWVIKEDIKVKDSGIVSN